jgi:acetyl esterase
MSLSEKKKQELAAKLRGNSVVTENISPEYRKNLELADRKEIKIPVGTSDDVTCYVFTAKNRTTLCPVHINIHGGGFVRPHFLRDEIYSCKVADAIKGIVVDVDYKLAPEYPFPAAFNECYEVGKWVFSQIKEWNADTTKISMGGHSAGANLTAAVALKANQTKDFSLCLQVLDYGAFDMFTDPSKKPDAENNLIPVERGRMFNLAYSDGDLSIAKNPYCSPLAATNDMLNGLPAALIISAGNDNFRYEDCEYAKRLTLAGVKVISKCFLESNHGFIIYCNGEWESAQKLIIDTILKEKL